MAAASDDILRYVDLCEADVRAAAFTDAERGILDTLNDKVGARESLEDVVDFLAAATRAISPCDRFAVAFVEEDGRRVVAHYTRAFYEPLLLKKGYAEDLSGSSLAEVINAGRPRLINDLERYLACKPDSRSTKILVREGVRSSMTCPLRVDDRNVGLLFRSSRQPGAYDDHQVLLHLAVAERLGQAVEKTYRIEQLAEANRAYFELLAFVTHELKSPIGSMLTEAGLLRDGYVGDLTAEQRERLEKMIGKGKYLLGLVGDYLELSRMEGGQVRLNTRAGVSIVDDVIEPAIEIITPQLEGRQMRLLREYADDLPPVELDPQLMKIVAVNLLSNAVKYGYEGGEVRIRAELMAPPASQTSPGMRPGAAGRLCVAVRNEGEGFAESERSRLFRRFSRLQAPELLKQRGTGVGLYTSWRIVQMHGGRMDAKSQHKLWAEFSFEIPQPPAGVGEGPGIQD